MSNITTPLIFRTVIVAATASHHDNYSDTDKNNGCADVPILYFDNDGGGEKMPAQPSINKGR
eukprot:11610368-Ditylum_brightwellii.AAC.1